MTIAQLSVVKIFCLLDLGLGDWTNILATGDWLNEENEICGYFLGVFFFFLQEFCSFIILVKICIICIGLIWAAHPNRFPPTQIFCPNDFFLPKVTSGMKKIYNQASKC